MTIRAYNETDVRKFLHNAGWLVAPAHVRKASYAEAVSDFQRAYNLGPKLVNDSIPGPKTVAAMIISEKAGYKLSKNFTATEFRCGCKGKNLGCRTIRVNRELLIGLEKVRATHYKTGLHIVSGYRCATFNKQIGGRVSPPSHHYYGNAVDIPRKVKAKNIKPEWGFRGIGVSAWDKLMPGITNRSVVHLDNGESRRVVFQE